MIPPIDSTVEFTIATRAGPRTYRAKVVGYRRPSGKRGGAGWVETRDDAGRERSVAPARCEIVPE